MIEKALLYSSAFFILLFFTSCSSIYFKSNHDIDILLGHHEDLTTLYEVKGSRDFYLWGLYPDDQIVFIDKEVAIQGARRAVVLKFGLDSDKRWNSLMYKIITFGMYYPVHYKIIAKGSADFE